MKYIGMPIGMWALFAHSFRKQLTEYYAKAMMTKPMKWFCAAGAERINSLKRTSTGKALTARGRSHSSLTTPAKVKSPQMLDISAFAGILF